MQIIKICSTPNYTNKRKILRRSGEGVKGRCLP
jgi:hypothetical protein